jgi:hypothetical protein
MKPEFNNSGRGEGMEHDDLIKKCARLEAENAVLKNNLKWTCFHCGFSTSDPKEARAHFGERDDAEESTPICKWWSTTDDQEHKEQFQALLQELNGERDRSMELLDNADIGEALLKAIKDFQPEFNWDICPSEVVLSLTNENVALKAQIESLERPFTEKEVRDRWPGASYADVGLANSMLLKRIGWDKWTDESIARSVKEDARVKETDHENSQDHKG